MGRLTFTSGLISDLRQRVIAHNEAPGAAPTRLGELKKVYQGAYRGQNPGEHAMGAVDRHLEKLCKAEPFDAGKHPRGKAGEFSAKAVAEHVPADGGAHAALQDSSAGYNALTSDVIPERRNEMNYGFYRELGSTAAGLALIASLARGRPNGLVTRAAQGALGALGRQAFALPIDAAGSAVHYATRRLAPRLLTRAELSTAVRQSGEFGQKFGRGLGRLSTSGASFGVNAILDMAASKGSGKKTAALYRGLALAGLALPPAYVLNNELKDSPVDPQLVGRTLDAYSYRTIQKMVQAPEIVAAHQAMLAALRDDDALQKAGGLYSRYGKTLFATLAGAAGAAVGHVATRKAIARGLGAAASVAAGAVAGGEIGVHEGNPNHDAKGRFTSRGAGIAGAVVGGALAGGGALLALSRHNAGAFRTLGRKTIDEAAAAMRAARTEYPTGTPHGDLWAKRSTLVRERYEADEEHTAAQAALDAHGLDPAVHYQTLVRNEINGKIAGVLAAHDATSLPSTKASEKGADVWETVGDLRRRSSSTPASTQTAVQRAVERLSPADFERAVAGLPDKERALALSLFNGRGAQLAKVNEVITAHDRALKASQKKLDRLEAQQKKTRGVKTEASIKLSEAHQKGASVEEMAPLQATFDQAKAAHDAVYDEYGKHADLHAKLSDAGADIRSPITGDPLERPTEYALNTQKRKLASDAKRRAELHVDKRIAIARSEYVSDLIGRQNSDLAAHVLLGRRTGAIPRDAKAAARSFLDSEKALTQQQAILERALKKKTSAKADLDELRLIQKGFKPKDMSDADIQKLQDTAADIVRTDEEANVLVTNARTEHTKLRGARNKAAIAYQEAFDASGNAKEGKFRLPPWLPAELRDDLELISRTPRSAARALMAAPGAAAMKAFVTAVLGSDPTKKAVKDGGVAAATKAGNAINQSVRDTYAELFMRQEKDGKWVHSPGKIAIRAANSAALLDFGRESLAYAHDKVLGSKDGGTPAEFPKQVKMEHKIDAVTGQGYTALSVPDPKNPNDRVVLWGQTYEDINKPPRPLHVGGSLSSVRSYQAEQAQKRKNNAGGGTGSYSDAPGLNHHDKRQIDDAINKLKSSGKLKSTPADAAGDISYRDNDAGEQHYVNLSNSFKKHVLNQMGNKPSALRSLYSAQGRILTNRQTYELLTGWKTGGQQAARGIFDDKRFGSTTDKEEVSDALQSEITKFAARAATDPVLAKNLHRAIATVATAKQLSTDSVKALHQQLASGAEATGAEASGEPPPWEETRRGSRAPPPLHETTELPDGWSQEALERSAGFMARNLDHADHLVHIATDHAAVIDMVDRMARAVHGLHPDEEITVHEGTKAAYQTLVDMASGGDENRAMAMDAVRTNDLNYFAGSLMSNARAVLDERVKEAAVLLDDFDALMKTFEPLAKDGQGSLGSTVIKEGAEGAVDAGLGVVRRKLAAGTAPPLAFLNPVRVANELGSNLAADSAWMIAGKLAEKFIPGGQAAGTALQLGTDAAASPGFRAGLGSFIARARSFLTPGGIAGAASAAVGSAKQALTLRNAAIQGTSLAASVGVGYAGGALANRGIQAAYAAGGKTAPAYAAPEEAPGPTVGRLGGNLGGNIAGMAAGAGVGKLVGKTVGGIGGDLLGPVGSVVGGALGSWAGGEAGSYIGKYFAGYDAPTAQRAASRYVGGAAATAQRHAPAITAMQPGRGPPTASAPSPGLATYQAAQQQALRNGSARAAPSGLGGHGGDPNHDQRGRFA